MAEITEVYVEYGETINKGNYENIKATIGARVNLEEGESASDIIGETYDLLKKQLHTKVNRLDG
jgi:hypothetical protein